MEITSFAMFCHCFWVVLFKLGFRIGEYDGNSSKTWCDLDPRCVKSLKPEDLTEMIECQWLRGHRMPSYQNFPTEALVDAEAGASRCSDGFV